MSLPNKNTSNTNKPKITFGQNVQATEQILPKTYQLPQQQQSNSGYQQQQQIPIQ